MRPASTHGWSLANSSLSDDVKSKLTTVLNEFKGIFGA